MKLRWFLLITLVVVALACNREATSWKGDWVVPLVNDSLAINSFVNDSTLAINSDNSIQVVLDRKLIDIDLSDLIEVPDTTVDQTFILGVNSILVNPGVSFINDIKEHHLSIDNVVLTKARIKSGKAKIQIENPVATGVNFEVSLPGMTKDGVEFEQSHFVPAATEAGPSVGEIYLDFKGYEVDFTGINGQAYNTLQSRFVVSSDANGPQITLTNQDEFNYIVSFEKLQFDYGKGYFGYHHFSDSINVNIEELHKITGGSINVEDIDLKLIVSNGIVAPGRAEITTFESINHHTNTSLALTHPYFSQLMNLNAASGHWEGLTPSELVFNFNENSGNLKEFLENLGGEYKLGYAIEINPYGNTSAGNNFLYPKSKMGVDLVADFPMKIGADNLVFLDTFKIDFKNDNKLLRIEEGELVLHTKNTFPYGLAIELTLLNADGEAIGVVLSNGQLTPAPTNTAENKHLEVEDKITFSIDKNLANSLKETDAIQLKAIANSTTFQNNVLYANATLKFMLMGNFKLKTEL